jgi:multidrug efflux pump
MWISDISVKRPVFATVLSLLLLIFGILTFYKLPQREYPDVNPPIVSIKTTYIGASAEVVETKITQPIEDSISGIEGIRTVESESQDGVSLVTIEFNIKRDIDGAAADVRDRVSRILNELPMEVKSPEITKVDANTQEVMWLRLTSDQYNAMQLSDYAERFLVDRFAVVDGVARVRIGGERRSAMRIWLDRSALAARNLTVDDIEKALKSENIEFPAGRLESYKREFTVRTKRLYNSIDDFRGLIIKRGVDGYLIKLGDIAEVEVGPEDARTELRSNGLPAIGIGIAKQSRANTLGVTRGIRNEMEKILASLPHGMELTVAFDTSLFIEAAIEEVYFTFFLTTMLVVLVIFIFLGNWRATFIPAITIPISLISAFIVLYLFDFSVNLLTLLALVLAIGLVVDDAIVVLENIYKKIEEGLEPLAAAFLGTRQVFFAVVATTVALVAVFVPISFLEGEVGRLFTEFAIALAGAVSFSCFVSLTLTPMLSAKILKKYSKQSPLTLCVQKTFEKILNCYKTALKWSLERRYLSFGLTLAAVPLIYLLFLIIPGEYEPTEDRGVILTIFKAPEGASLEYTKIYSRKIEEDLQALINKKEASQTLMILPLTFTTTGSVNSGLGIVLLEPWEKRKRSSQEIVGELFGSFMNHPGIFAIPILPKGLSNGRFSQPIEIVIQGTSYEELAEWRDLFLNKIYSYPGIVNVDYDYKETKPQIVLEIDRDRAGSLGISGAVIGKTLQTMLGSCKTTTYLDKGKEYSVMLQGKPEERRSVADLENIYVRSEISDDLIPLSNLVSLTEKADSASLNRFNRMRAITFSANIAPGYTQGQVLDHLAKTAREILPKVARIDYKGESRTYKETGGSFIFAFGLSLVIIYMVLAAQFESFIHPLVILVTAPLAVLGALLGLFLFGISLNIYSQLGILMLGGLAAKNGILIVEFANQLRNTGKEIRVAILEASLVRFRPILMTSLATAIGAIPLVLAKGAGAESRASLGIVVFSGVMFSTFLTLFVVPVFYEWMTKNARPRDAVAQDLENQLKKIT